MCVCVFVCVCVCVCVGGGGGGGRNEDVHYSLLTCMFELRFHRSANNISVMLSHHPREVGDPKPITYSE